MAEALTNIAKHSGATRGEERWSGTDRVALGVWDHGLGGADEHNGTGLVGIRRGVAAFDGTMTLDNPVGGPTTLRVTLPRGD